MIIIKNGSNVKIGVIGGLEFGENHNNLVNI